MITNDVQTGQRLRITLLVDVVATDDDVLEAAAAEAQRAGQSRFSVPKKIVAHKGTIYVGIATDVDQMGFFDLNLDNGEAVCFYADDSTILIEVLEGPTI
jgi:hypothetical protein